MNAVCTEVTGTSGRHERTLASHRAGQDQKQPTDPVRHQKQPWYQQHQKQGQQLHPRVAEQQLHSRVAGQQREGRPQGPQQQQQQRQPSRPQQARSEKKQHRRQEVSLLQFESESGNKQQTGKALQHQGGDSASDGKKPDSPSALEVVQAKLVAALPEDVPQLAEEIAKHPNQAAAAFQLLATAAATLPPSLPAAPTAAAAAAGGRWHRTSSSSNGNLRHSQQQQQQYQLQQRWLSDTQQQQQAAIYQLAQQLSQQLADQGTAYKLTPATLSSTTFHLSRLGIYNLNLMPQLEARSQQLLPSCSPNQLGQLLQGFAALDHLPSPSWLVTFYSVSLVLLVRGDPRFGPQQLASSATFVAGVLEAGRGESRGARLVLSRDKETQGVGAAVGAAAGQASVAAAAPASTAASMARAGATAPSVTTTVATTITTTTTAAAATTLPAAPAAVEGFEESSRADAFPNGCLNDASSREQQQHPQRQQRQHVDGQQQQMRSERLLQQESPQRQQQAEGSIAATKHALQGKQEQQPEQPPYKQQQPRQQQQEQRQQQQEQQPRQQQLEQQQQEQQPRRQQQEQQPRQQHVAQSSHVGASGYPPAGWGHAFLKAAAGRSQDMRPRLLAAVWRLVAVLYELGFLEQQRVQQREMEEREQQQQQEVKLQHCFAGERGGEMESSELQQEQQLKAEQWQGQQQHKVGAALGESAMGKGAESKQGDTGSSSSSHSASDEHISSSSSSRVDASLGRSSTSAASSSSSNSCRAGGEDSTQHGGRYSLLSPSSTAANKSKVCQAYARADDGLEKHLQQLLAAFEKALPYYRATELAVVLEAMAVLQPVLGSMLQPGGALAERLLLQVQVQLPYATALEVAGYMWAVAKLGLQPGDVWVDGVVVRMQALLPGISGRGLARVAVALAGFRRRPYRAWVYEYCQRCRVEGFSMQGQELVETLWGLAEIGVVLDPEVLHVFVLGMKRCMGQMGSEQLLVLSGSLRKMYPKVLPGRKVHHLVQELDRRAFYQSVRP